VPPLVDHGRTRAVSYELQEIMDLDSKQVLRATSHLSTKRTIRNVLIAASRLKSPSASTQPNACRRISAIHDRATAHCVGRSGGPAIA